MAAMPTHLIQPRANRYVVDCPLRFRAQGGQWRDGTVRNLSTTGLLFEAEPAPGGHDELEMEIYLEPYSSRIRGTAVIVRVNPDEHAMAARFVESHLEPAAETETAFH
jgi:hypothetical protein